jgi:hypothetical protein
MGFRETVWRARDCIRFALDRDKREAPVNVEIKLEVP